MKTPEYLLRFILFLALAITFSSCDRGGPVYQKSLKMKNSTWDRFDMKLFEFAVDDTTKNYDIALVVNCTESFPYDNLPVYVILTTPSGEERMREVTLRVRENNKLSIEPESKKAEARVVLWKGIAMSQKGKCKISIENMIPKIQTEGIDEIGIMVTESK